MKALLLTTCASEDTTQNSSETASNDMENTEIVTDTEDEISEAEEIAAEEEKLVCFAIEKYIVLQQKVHNVAGQYFPFNYFVLDNAFFNRKR